MKGAILLATWEEIGLDSNKAALKMMQAGHLRSSVSRFYYAAYSAATGRLTERGVAFPEGWHNPRHERLSMLTRHHLDLPKDRIRVIVQSVSRLYKYRISADYRSGESFQLSDVRNCSRDALSILRELEILE
ncbi:MAG: HEPN domain-containing protein [Armatimonadetes bacterium]|nr:HEPN domain-containing protein [Armatimonadota bacterium]